MPKAMSWEEMSQILRIKTERQYPDISKYEWRGRRKCEAHK